MKILLSAYACEPNYGSEPEVGWNMADTLAQQHQVHVLTSAAHRSGIEAELARHPHPNLAFTYVDPGWVHDWSGQRRFQPNVNVHYYLWQIQAYRVAKQLHQGTPFDLAHHVTYVRYYNPSFISRLPIPFVWGPVGGAETAPRSFWVDFHWKNRLFEGLRDTVRAIGELDPAVKMTLRRSAIAWAATNDTALRLQKLGGGQRVQVMSALSLRGTEVAELRTTPPPTTPLRLISIGRLLHWKGFHLGLRAFAAAQLPAAEYWVVGNGPEMGRLQALAQELGIMHQVKFFGPLSRPETLAQLQQASVLVHPSLHDSGGFVCLEAMAAGRPVICLDLGGPGVLVTAQTGFKIPATNPATAVAELAAAMQQLATQPDRLKAMGQMGQQHIEQHYNWDNRKLLLQQIYQGLEQQGLAQSMPGEQL
jgi:glycosyltransferase involved in cell wall biosynthesis